MLVKRLTFKGKPGKVFLGSVGKRDLKVHVLPEGKVTGHPLVTLGDNSGLPHVRDVYAR
jgi:hypothetical protein